MAQLANMLASIPDTLSSIPQGSHGEKREQTPTHTQREINI